MTAILALILNWRSVLSLVLAGAALAVGYALGHAGGVTAGRAQAQAAQDHRAVADLTQILQSQSALIAQANAASRAMRQAAARREGANRKTTQELHDALAATADRRANCVFDAGVLRQLHAARNRAADAATGGIRGALPATTADAVKP